jgi:hypothetical protein
VGGVRGEDWLYFVASVSVRGRRAETLRSGEREGFRHDIGGRGVKVQKVRIKISTAFFGKYGEQCCADTPV